MDDGPLGKLRSIAPSLVAALLGVLSFLPAIRHSFVYDDHILIAANPSVTRPGTLDRFWFEPFWPKGTSVDKLYRPLTVFSYRLNALTGPDPAHPDPRPFHAANLFLHALVSALVARLALVVTSRLGVAYLAGVLFATHPVNTEAVVTGYGRSELLAAVFSLALFLRHATEGAHARPSTLRASLWGFVFFLALCSKEHALLVLPALLAFDGLAWSRDSSGRHPSWSTFLNGVLPLRHLAYLIAFVVYIVLRFNVLGGIWLSADSVHIGENPLGSASLFGQLAMPFRLLWLTVGLLVWPPNLCPIWSWPALSPPVTLSADVLLGIVAFVALVAACIRAFVRRSRLAPVWLALLALLAIPLHLLPAANWLFAERWLYLPMACLFILVAAAVDQVRRLTALLAFPLACLLGWASWDYAGAFASNVSMAQESVQRQPMSYQGRLSLALALARADRPLEAIDAAETLVAMFGEGPQAHWVFMHSSLALGDGGRAKASIEALRRLLPGVPEDAFAAESKRAEELLQRR